MKTKDQSSKKQIYNMRKKMQYPPPPPSKLTFNKNRYIFVQMTVTKEAGIIIFAAFSCPPHTNQALYRLGCIDS